MVKLGLGDSYDNTVIQKKVRAYVDLTKPASSFAIMMAVLFSTLVYGELYSTGGISFAAANWQELIYAAVTLFLIHGGAQSLNMAEDAEADMQTEHKQNRPIPAGIVTKEEARSVAWVVITVGVARAFVITTSFGVYALLLAFNGIFYNLDPIRAKERLWINVIWQALSRGLLLYPATFAVWGNPLDTVAWSMGVIAFLLVLSMQQTADFNDVKVDEKFGVITPAVHYEFSDLLKIMSGIVILMFSVLALMIEAEIIPNFWLLYLLTIPIFWSIYYLWKYPGGVSDISGQSPTWYVYYATLASLYVLPAIQLMYL